MNWITEIEQLFVEQGSRRYELHNPLGVSQFEHALQCASLAQEFGATETLIIAALLHDIGHLLPKAESTSVQAQKDDLHQFIALLYLRQHLPNEALEPIKLHVDAKRYLCSVDDCYWASLSQGSKVSLDLQGGPFSPEAAARFIELPYAEEAVMLRRWDDRSKVLGKTVAAFDTYRPMLTRHSIG